MCLNIEWKLHRWYLQWITWNEEENCTDSRNCNRSWYCNREQFYVRCSERVRVKRKMATNLHVIHNDNSKIECSKCSSNFYIYLMHGNFNHQFESSNEFCKFHLVSCNRLTRVYLCACVRICVYLFDFLLLFSFSSSIHEMQLWKLKLNEYPIQSNWMCVYILNVRNSNSIKYYLKCCLASQPPFIRDTFVRLFNTHRSMHIELHTFAIK